MSPLRNGRHPGWRNTHFEPTHRAPAETGRDVVAGRPQMAITTWPGTPMSALLFTILEQEGALRNGRSSALVTRGSLRPSSLPWILHRVLQHGARAQTRVSLDGQATRHRPLVHIPWYRLAEVADTPPMIAADRGAIRTFCGLTAVCESEIRCNHYDFLPSATASQAEIRVPILLACSVGIRAGLSAGSRRSHADRGIWSVCR